MNIPDEYQDAYLHAQSVIAQAATGDALNQCASCGSYRLDGLPPAIHKDECPNAGDAFQWWIEHMARRDAP